MMAAKQGVVDTAMAAEQGLIDGAGAMMVAERGRGDQAFI